MRAYISLLASALLLTACAEYPTSYSTSFNNQRTLDTIKTSQSQQIKMSVGVLQDKDNRNKLICRGNSSIVLWPEAETFVHYIQEAIISELKADNGFSWSSPKQLNGQLDTISFQGGAFNQTTWVIRMTFYDKNNKPFTVTSVFPFAADVKDKRFCEHVSSAFPSAVENFINQLFKNPKFQQCLK